MRLCPIRLLEEMILTSLAVDLGRKLVTVRIYHWILVIIKARLILPKQMGVIQALRARIRTVGVNLRLKP
jgi:hypothetical protein